MTVLIWRYASPIPLPGLHGANRRCQSGTLSAPPRPIYSSTVRRTPRRICAHSCISLGETLRRCALEVLVGRQNRNGANLRAVRRQPYRRTLRRGQTAFRIGSPPLFTAREALAKGEDVQVLPEWNSSAVTRRPVLLWAEDSRHMPARMRGDDRLSQRDGVMLERRQHRASEIIANHGMITPNTNQIPSGRYHGLPAANSQQGERHQRSSQSAAKGMTTNWRIP